MLEKDIQKARRELLERWERERPSLTHVRWVDNDGIFVAVKDESFNLTDTYKAKHGWMMGQYYIEEVFPNPFIYYLGSTGNAGIADFAFADRLNEILGEQKVLVANFYPLEYIEGVEDEKTGKKTGPKILGPDSFGRSTDGRIFAEAMRQFKSGKLIDVSFKDIYWKGQPCVEEMANRGIIATPDNSLDITEGFAEVFQPTYKQVMQEFIDQIRDRYGDIPRTLVIIQFGAGMLYDDSEKVVKEQGLSDKMEVVAVSTGRVDTIADKIGDSTESWQESLADLRNKGFTRAINSGDSIYQVEDPEILRALERFRAEGIEAEPSGAAGMAIVPRANEIATRPYDLVAVINTGNGIKQCC